MRRLFLNFRLTRKKAFAKSPLGLFWRLRCSRVGWYGFLWPVSFCVLFAVVQVPCPQCLINCPLAKERADPRLHHNLKGAVAATLRRVASASAEIQATLRNRSRPPMQPRSAPLALLAGSGGTHRLASPRRLCATRVNDPLARESGSQAATKLNQQIKINKQKASPRKRREAKCLPHRALAACSNQAAARAADEQHRAQQIDVGGIAGGRHVRLSSNVQHRNIGAGRAAVPLPEVVRVTEKPGR